MRLTGSIHTVEHHTGAILQTRHTTEMPDEVRYVPGGDGEAKTEASDSTLPLPGICVTALRLPHDDQARDRAAAGPAWHDNRVVFTTRYGTPIEPRNFNRFWDARCAKVGVRKITIHDGRRG